MDELIASACMSAALFNVLMHSDGKTQRSPRMTAAPSVIDFVG